MEGDVQKVAYLETGNATQLFSLLQLAGGNFPVGGFSQSWGLETYVAQRKIKNVRELEEFLNMFVKSVLCSCDGPVMIHAYKNAINWNCLELRNANNLFLAMKVTKESREAALKMGKALMRICAELLEDEDVSAFCRETRDKGISFPVGFGIVAAKFDISIKAAIGAYFFSAVNGLVQSGIKLIPLGNLEAQKLLLSLQIPLEQAATTSFLTEIDEIHSFAPMLEIASMEHELLRTRLYMS